MGRRKNVAQEENLVEQESQMENENVAEENETVFVVVDGEDEEQVFQELTESPTYEDDNKVEDEIEEN
jgi:Zn/Cd-binding protein ZinT